MAKGFFAEATNGTFMPAQAIEMPRVRTIQPKIKSENAIDFGPYTHTRLDKPRLRSAHSDDVDASPGHHSHRCLHTRPLRGGRIRPRHRAPHSPPLGGERDHAPHMAHTPTESHHRYVRVQDAATKEELAVQAQEITNLDTTSAP